jgi:hypothetical protein
MQPGCTTMDAGCPLFTSFQTPFLLDQYETDAMNVCTGRSALGWSWRLGSTWEAELDGVMLFSETIDSTGAVSGSLMLYPGIVSGTSSSSKSSLELSEDSESSSLKALELSDETSDG